MQKNVDYGLRRSLIFGSVVSVVLHGGLVLSWEFFGQPSTESQQPQPASMPIEVTLWSESAGGGGGDPTTQTGDGGGDSGNQPMIPAIAPKSTKETPRSSPPQATDHSPTPSSAQAIAPQKNPSRKITPQPRNPAPNTSPTSPTTSNSPPSANVTPKTAIAPSTNTTTTSSPETSRGTGGTRTSTGSSSSNGGTSSGSGNGTGNGTGRSSGNSTGNGSGSGSGNGTATRPAPTPPPKLAPATPPPAPPAPKPQNVNCVQGCGDRRDQLNGQKGFAIVQVEIAPSGSVVSASIVSSSGNASLDQKAIAAARGMGFNARESSSNEFRRVKINLGS